MRLAVVGTGYVGLVTGACFSHLGNDVTCIDVIEDKVRTINSGKVPIFEPGLEDMVKEGLASGHLRATTDFSKVTEADFIFICVGTPSFDDGSLDLKYVKDAAGQIGTAISNSSNVPVIIMKSTVMPRTTQHVVMPILEKASGRKAGTGFGLAMNPEFLKEGAAVQDFLHPDRIVIGAIDDASYGKVAELYNDFDCPILHVPLSTAEMVKVASNAFLATKISFVNEVGNICKAMGIDFRQVAVGMGMDARIGKLFLRPGCGFGGSCFPKDLEGIIAEGRKYDASTYLLEAVRKVNREQPLKLVRLLENKMAVKGRTIAVLGLAFKPETDDIREASSLTIVRELLARGAKVRAYDPKAMDLFRKSFPQITYCRDAEDCISGSDAIMIVTEWKEFADPSLYGDKLVVDGRGVVRTNNYEGICW
ncbi:MAG: UDP-glucose/GDP-mannose dehydrogenase family protein [Euryarchaeota archaeon]|nr:UDP-glucose/GDP-mannose dehydrogenase family protein [Euryarchaeota archaeon]